MQPILCARRSNRRQHVGLEWGKVDKANLSRVGIRTASGDNWWYTRTYRYDKYGNVSEKKSAGGGTRKIEWDEVYLRFPTKETITDTFSEFCVILPVLGAVPST